jgi:hypothetical protein
MNRQPFFATTPEGSRHLLLMRISQVCSRARQRLHVGASTALDELLVAAAREALHRPGITATQCFAIGRVVWGLAFVRGGRA